MADLKISIELDGSKIKSEAKTINDEIGKIGDESVKSARKSKSLAEVDYSSQIRQLRALREQFGQLTSSASQFFSSFAGNLASTAISAISAKLYEGGKAILDYSARLEQTKIGFETLMGSAEAAQKHLDELRKFANETPFSFEGLADASRRFQNVGLDAKKVIPIMKSVGDAVAAAGGSSETLDRVTVAISQIVAKGKVSAEEINQLAESGVGGWRILSEQLGKSTADVMKLAEQGQISSDVFLQAFQNFSSQNYGDAMQKQSRTFSGAWSTITDTVTTAAEGAFAPMFEKVSTLAVDLSQEIQAKGGDLEAVGDLIAKYIAKGIGSLGRYAFDSFIQDVKDFAAGNKDIYTPFEFGQDIGKAWEEGSKSVKQFSVDVNKAVDMNGVKYKLDPLTNTLQRVKETVEKTPNLAKQLDAQKAADDAKKLGQELNKMATDYATKIFFFGQESEVAAAKQQLLAKGVNDFSTGTAKAILGMAAMLDVLKANQIAADEAKNAQDKYNDKLKSASDELTQIREAADFDLKFANPTEIDRFNQKINQSGAEFRSLTFEINETRKSLELLALVRKLGEAGAKTNNFIDSLKQSIESLNETATTPFQDKIRELLSGIDLFTVAGEKLDNAGIAKNIESKILAFQRDLKILNDSAANAIGDPETIKAQLQVKTEKAISDWYESFIAFMRTIRQKVEANGTIEFPAFFEGSEGNLATAEKFIELFEQFFNAAKTTNLTTFKDTIADLDIEIADLNRELAGGVELSKADAVAKMLQTDAYKNLTPEMRKVIEAKAKEVDDLRASIKAQDAYREAFEQTADVLEDALTNVFEKNWGGLLDSILGELKRFLIRAAAELLTSKLFGFLSGKGFGGGNSSGGFLSNIFGGLFGSGGGIGGTPNFEGNNFSAGGGIFGAIRNWFGGGGQASTGTMAANAPKATPGGGFGLSGGLSLAAIGATIAGGLIGGIGGSTLSGAGMGAQIGSMIAPGIGTAIGAGIGAIAGLFGGIFGRNSLRKKEEKVRNQGMLDALSQLKDFDTIIADSRNLKYNPPSSALTAGEQLGANVLQQYMQMANSLTDKKTRSHAIKDADRVKDAIAAKMKILEATVREAQSAFDIDSKLQTSFATGVYLGRDDQMRDMQRSLDFKRRNGMLAGAWTGKDILPSMLAKGEMVLNPSQIQQVMINAGGDPFKNAGIPGYNTGAYIAPPSPSAPSNSSNNSSSQSVESQPVTVQIFLKNSGIVESDIEDVMVKGLKKDAVQVEVVKAYDKGKARNG